MSAFDPFLPLGAIAKQRRYVIGKFPSRGIAGDSASSEPAFPRSGPGINEWPQIDAVVLFKPFEELDAVPAGDTMLITYELIRSIRQAPTRLLVNELQNVT